jgi:hypothetical protein
MRHDTRCKPARPKPPKSPGSAFRFGIEAVRKLEPKDLQTSQYVTGESLLNSYAKTLTGNYLLERFPTMPTASLDDWARQDPMMLCLENWPEKISKIMLHSLAKKSLLSIYCRGEFT